MVAFPARVRVPYGDVEALAETVRPIITPWYSGYIYIINPSDNTNNTDIDTGVMEITVHPYWAGESRIQPIRSNLLSKQTTNDTTTRVVQFQAGYAKDRTFPDVPPGHLIIVANGGNDKTLELYQYVVIGSLNSSSAFNETVFAQVNLEARANWTIGDPMSPEVELWPLE